LSEEFEARGVGFGGGKEKVDLPPEDSPL